MGKEGMESVLWKIKVYGIVQSVGFRPFISLLAKEYGICGTVSNCGSFVEIMAQGEKCVLDAFLQDISRKAPKKSSILNITCETAETDVPYLSFDIIESQKETGEVYVSPDLAICDACKEELMNPADRRYLHPFINCTSCGPRLTIMESMPYDRERTSMKEFSMCEECEQEYHSPHDRRYDAQPVCCKSCGPELFLLGTDIRGNEAVRKTRQVLASGGIAAVKGIGGFHLCCDARNADAVDRLRKRKHRPAKPFAVMLRDLSAVQKECLLSGRQEDWLDGAQKPILLLHRKDSSTICEAVAPKSRRLGVLLPYAPIHLLLFDFPDGVDMPDALVMTSGNPSGAPICHTDKEASSALGGIADIILTHNRRIRLRADDSVMDWLGDKPYMIRRSRGFSPIPFRVSRGLRGEVLAVGGELKNSFCLGKNGLFYPSPYIGDMSDLRTVEAWKDSVSLMESLLEIRPKVVACDMHPRYQTVQLSHALGLPVFPVQHHYAHVLSCMAENDFLKPVIGISLDGTGYGTDGTIWGGEILVASPDGFQRVGSIAPFRQAGGDCSSLEGWRIAVSMIYDACKRDKDKTVEICRALQLCTEQELKTQFFLLDQQVNTVVSTSAGRLFDAVSAVLGIKKQSSFEGEAAMCLQYEAERQADGCSLPMGRLLQEAQENFIILSTNELFRHILEEALRGTSVCLLAYAFHDTLAEMLLSACRKIRERTGLSVVALSGGVFQNTLLASLVCQRLEREDFRPLLHSMIPPNDGGICLGQAVAAMWHIQD